MLACGDRGEGEKKTNVFQEGFKFDIEYQEYGEIQIQYVFNY